jgi:hypothetical protein
MGGRLIVLTINGREFTGDAVTFDAPTALHRMTGRRHEGTVTNGRQSATFAIFDRDLWAGSGGFTLTVEPNPGWWTRTENEARVSIGLPPI